MPTLGPLTTSSVGAVGSRDGESEGSADMEEGYRDLAGVFAAGVLAGGVLSGAFFVGDFSGGVLSGAFSGAGSGVLASGDFSSGFSGNSGVVSTAGGVFASGSVPMLDFSTAEGG